MAKMRFEVGVDDKASPVLNKIAENTKAAAAKIVQSDKQIGEATKLASRAKAEQLSLSQKMKFALAKEEAAGNKLRTSLVNQKEALAKTERKLRAAIKAGDAESQALAKQSVELRKNVKALQSKIDKEESGKLTSKGYAGAILAATAAVAGAAAGAFLFTKRIADQGDEMIKASQRLNLTTDEYQKLDFAMKISGTSIEAQKGSMTRFARTARDASSGVRIAEDAFHRLGVTVKNQDGTFKGTNELLMEVSESFKDMPPSVEKSAISMDLFGRSGAQLSQFLNLGKEGLQALGAEAAALGGIMSEKAAKQSEEFIDALTRMETAAGGVARGIGEEMQPAFTRAMNQVAESIVDLKGAYRPIFQDMARFIDEAAVIIVPILGFIAKAFVGVATTASLAWKGLLLVINQFISDMIDDANRFIRAFDKVAPAAMQIGEIGNVFQSTADDIAREMGNVVEASAKTMEAIDKVGEALVGNAEIVVKDTIPAGNAMRDMNQKAVQTLKELEAAEKKIADRREAHASRYVAERARMLDANLTLQEDLIRMAEAEKEKVEETFQANIKASGKAGQAMGQNLANAFMAGETAAEGFANVVRTASVTALDAVRDSVIKSIMARAGEAASGAAASQAFIPFVGPFLAAAAAAAMFTLVSGYISGMAKGGVVPGIGDTDSVAAMLTPGEIVLPKDISKLLLEVVGKPAPAGGMQAGGLVTGGSGIVINFNDQGVVPRSPAELDLFIKDRLVPSLTRLRRKGAYA